MRKQLRKRLKQILLWEKIWLIRNQIGDEGAKVIGEAFEANTTLKEIRIYDNEISAEVNGYLKDKYESKIIV